METMSFQIGVIQIAVPIRDRDFWKQNQKLFESVQTLMPRDAQ